MIGPGPRGRPDAHEQVLEAARAFGLGTAHRAPSYAARGQHGEIWRLTTEQGDFAVKLMVAAPDRPVPQEADVRADVTFAEEAGRRGLRVPQALRTGEGDLLVQLPGVTVRVYRWLELSAPRRDLDPRRLGAALATLHRSPLPATGPVHPWYTEPVDPDTWQQVADRLVAAGAPFAEAFAGAVPGFVDLQQLFREPVSTQLCHRDLCADNVRQGDPPGITILDWENCGAAESTQELAVMLFEFCAGDPVRAATLATSYRRHGGPGRVRDPGDFTMALAQFGHFAITAGQRWLRAGDDLERARARAWFEEGQDDPLDRAAIERLIRAVASP